MRRVKERECVCMCVRKMREKERERERNRQEARRQRKRKTCGFTPRERERTERVFSACVSMARRKHCFSSYKNTHTHPLNIPNLFLFVCFTCFRLNIQRKEKRNKEKERERKRKKERERIHISFSGRLFPTPVPPIFFVDNT